MATAPARNADLALRELRGIAELSAGAGLIGEVFGATSGEPVPADLRRAISLSGGYIGGAFLGDALVGVAVGFGEIQAPGGPPPTAMHSHVAAVSEAARGQRIGWNLKMHQREWALARGIDAIEWTFDPLVRRNAFVNLTLLGARGVRYLPNLYGEIPDALNAGQESDRILVRWDLNSPTAIAATQGSIAEPVLSSAEIAAATLPPSDEAGAPIVRVEAEGGSAPRARGRLLCGTPGDIEAMLATNPEQAKAWRRAQRSVLAPAIESGSQITGSTRTGRYPLEETS